MKKPLPMPSKIRPAYRAARFVAPTCTPHATIEIAAADHIAGLRPNLWAKRPPRRAATMVPTLRKLEINC
jgi:hypothetical protein